MLRKKRADEKIMPDDCILEGRDGGSRRSTQLTCDSGGSHCNIQNVYSSKIFIFQRHSYKMYTKYIL
jgi:hypothetical protein